MRGDPLYLPGARLPREPRGLLLCDRDGTVIENRDSYVLSPADVCFLPGAVEALRTATTAGWAVVLVTNQSPVGRGLLTEADCTRIHEGVVDTLSAAGVRVVGSYLCPHAPQDGCGCRKPAPGMALLAQQRFGTPPERCHFVGDSVEDMLAAVASGMHPLLVRTGRGAAHAPLARRLPELRRVRVVADLRAAVAVAAGTSGAHPVRAA